ncbi:hypothetical protein [Haliea sp. E17]|uniref:hypothetical protein n=1 Tax=Haliea sp. E17 TaxID=3401576 RepID=UPI003AB084C7
MKPFTLTALALILGASQAIAADCSAPEKPVLPDGATSTMEQMLEGQQAVKTYQAENIAYRECLEPAMEEAKLAAEQGDSDEESDEATQNFMAIQDAYNASVTAEEEVAGQFNTEVREYKAANP